MMIRTLQLALILACCSSALAQSLYKWVEADGSITFSPEKPRKNIDFQVINAQEGVTPSRIAVRDSTTATNSMPATEEASNTRLSSNDSSPLLHKPAASSVSSATQLNADTTQSNARGSDTGAQASMLQQRSENTRQFLTPAMAAVQKQNRCEDLRKRVVSLERRLKSTLTTADMDNTVMHISDYQKNYDKHCVQ